ncbi:MAG: acetyl-CoA carboxylase biotin carboxyl carrier protein subunit, partial [Pseudomonadales bacterium]
RAAARVLRSMQSGWRNTVMPFETIKFVHGGEECHLEYRSQRDGSFRFRTGTDGEEFSVLAYHCDASAVDLEIDGVRMAFQLTQDDDDWLVHSQAGDLTLTQLPRFPRPGAADEGGGLTAPMPGAVLTLEATPGAQVSKGDLLLTIEAMKMEHRITAPTDGRIATVHTAVGDQVENGQLLVSLETESKE